MVKRVDHKSFLTLPKVCQGDSIKPCQKVFGKTKHFQINPKAILRAADARCGARYAVYVVPSPGEFGTRCTDYLPLEQLEQYLLGVFNANEFIRLIRMKCV